MVGGTEQDWTKAKKLITLRYSQMNALWLGAPQCTSVGLFRTALNCLRMCDAIVFEEAAVFKIKKPLSFVTATNQHVHCRAPYLCYFTLVDCGTQLFFVK